MKCPDCKSKNIGVTETRSEYESFNHRYRRCKDCFCVWQTAESIIKSTVQKPAFFPNEIEEFLMNEQAKP